MAKRKRAEMSASEIEKAQKIVALRVIERPWFNWTPIERDLHLVARYAAARDKRIEALEAAWQRIELRVSACTNVGMSDPYQCLRDVLTIARGALHSTPTEEADDAAQ